MNAEMDRESGRSHAEALKKWEAEHPDGKPKGPGDMKPVYIDTPLL
jgi:hypothetical protein